MIIDKCKFPQSGFSLIELIFAMLFLTVIVFGVVRLQTSNLTLTNTQNNELKAHFLANQGAEIVEAIVTWPLAACSPSCTKYIEYSDTSKNYSLSGSNPGAIDGLFDRTIEFDSSGLTDAYLVTVIVEWTDSSGEHKKGGADVTGGIEGDAHVEARRIIY